MIRNKKLFGKYFVKKNNNKNLHKKKKFPYILYGISILLILDLIFYPFEGFFIRFNSLEKSINYSISDYYSSDFKIIEDNDTIFFVKLKNSNYSYHSVAKDNEKYYLCDFKTCKSSNTKIKYLRESEFSGILQTDIILNKITNKSCYFCKIVGNPESDVNKLNISESLNNGFKIIYRDNNSIIFYFISGNNSTDSCYFKFLGQIYTFV